MAESNRPRPHAFLSYASADRERALHLADLLEAHRVAVWIDRKSIAGGASWSEEIVRGVEGRHRSGRPVLRGVAGFAPRPAGDSARLGSPPGHPPPAAPPDVRPPAGGVHAG